MADTEKLSSVLDSLIDQNTEQAQVDFHEYLRGKMQEVIGSQPEETDEFDTEE